MLLKFVLLLKNLKNIIFLWHVLYLTLFLYIYLFFPYILILSFIIIFLSCLSPFSYFFLSLLSCPSPFCLFSPLLPLSFFSVSLLPSHFPPLSPSFLPFLLSHVSCLSLSPFLFLSLLSSLYIFRLLYFLPQLLNKVSFSF